MSVINKMLQDLDKRQALGADGGAGMVRAPAARTGGHEWFWRVLVVLLACALGWMAWVGFQLMPRKPLVTDLAFQAAAAAQTRAKPAPAAPAAASAPAVVAAAAAVETPKEEAKPVEPKVQVDALRLAMQLETPIPERQTATPKPVSLKPKAKAESAPSAPIKVDKRPRTENSADAHFRRAALLLGNGRVAEAEAELAATLRLDATHAAARQAYVALLLEQGRVVGAEQLLQDGLALDAQQPAFALALARIYAGRREFNAALEVLDKAGPATGNADFHAMRAAVLQRLGRHGEAVDEYQGALNAGGQAPGTWIGFGISLEALGRKSEALLAYRRALASGPIAAEAREYAEGRAKALE